MHTVLNQRTPPVPRGPPDGTVSFGRTLTRAFIIAFRPRRPVTVHDDSRYKVSIIRNRPHPDNVSHKSDHIQPRNLVKIGIPSRAHNGGASYNLMPAFRNKEVVLKKLSFTGKLERHLGAVLSLHVKVLYARLARFTGLYQRAVSRVLQPARGVLRHRVVGHRNQVSGTRARTNVAMRNLRRRTEQHVKMHRRDHSPSIAFNRMLLPKSN